MDYTERPQNNMHPDKNNFETLEGMYGNVDGTSVRVAKSALPTDGGKKRRIQARERRAMEDEESEKEFQMYATHLTDPVRISTRGGRSRPGLGAGWRLLRKTETVELHEKDLGDGYYLLTSVLLA